MIASVTYYRTIILVGILVLAMAGSLYAQLSSGDIMFTSFNADGSDGFSIVALVDIPANSTIYFTDNEWNGLTIGGLGAFLDANEGELTWSTGAAVILKGQVISFTETNNAANTNYGASVGTISGILDLNSSNEVLYAFTGTNDTTPTTFLSAITNSSFSTLNGPLTNTGLTEGSTATAISGNNDVMVYSGSTDCNSTQADCTAMLANAANWSVEDGVGDQSVNTVFPDVPADEPTGFGGSLLPIVLSKFEVGLTANGYVRVQWETAMEINNDFFTVERSSDGIEWEGLAQIQGAGNSTDALDYDFIDEEPLMAISYYRLKQTDYDGQVSVSSARKIYLHAGSNPQARILRRMDERHYVLQDVVDKEAIKIYNLYGSDQTREAQISYMGTRADLLLDRLAVGVYVVVVEGFTQRIILR